MRYGNIKIFTGNSNPVLAAQIAQVLGLPMGQNAVGRFSDGEISVNTFETVRGCDVFVVQSTCTPVNDNLMELLIMIDSFKRASAGRITAVIPYYGYARQDRKAKARDPITAKLVADLIDAAGADRVLTMDLHALQIQGFFNIPVDHMLGMPTLVEHYKESRFTGGDVVVVSPDLGSVTRARAFAEQINAPLAIVDKRRLMANMSEIMNLIGEVKGKRTILFDDMIDTAGTIVNGANALMERGALEVYACCTHGVLSGPAIERIGKSPIKELVITNTIPLPSDAKVPKIKVLSVARVFAEAIERIYEDLPVSSLFTRTPSTIRPITLPRKEDLE
jgi:ribose-phosphate pyrophosphokinase